MFEGPDDLLAYVKKEGIEMIDVRFCDLIGIMQHFTVPAREFDKDQYENGLAFDGSSIRGFQKINESDMALLPDPTTAWVDPFRERKTLIVNFNVHDPITKEAYSRDPRNIARKAEAYLASTGLGDTAFFAPEAEFYVFDDIRFDTRQNTSYYSIDSEAGAWNTGRTEDGGNRGYKVKYKGGYFPVAPTDHFGDLRDEIVTIMESLGMKVERAHHEVGTAGQAEINWRFDTLSRSADDVMKFKYIVKNVAWQHGKTATFMPKPIFGDNGSGMHVHSSIWKGGEPLFFDESGYAQLSDMARYYIGGILKHAPSLLAFTNPQPTRTTVWYRASRPQSIWCTRSATAPPACVSRSPARTRKPSASNSVAQIRLPTLTWPSPPCYWPAWTASEQDRASCAGRQGHLRAPPEEHAAMDHVPGSLGAVLDNLEADHEFLLAGDVFTPDLIETWVELKRGDLAALQQRPHPYEFDLYYDI